MGSSKDKGAFSSQGNQRRNDKAKNTEQLKKG